MALKNMSNIQDFRDQIKSKKFCFCLPVRLGVFVVSLLTMLAGSVIGVIGWMQVAGFRQHPVEVTDEIAAYIHASIFSLLGLLSIFGFVGSLAKQRGLVIAYSIGLAIHLGLSIASGVFTIYSIFRPNPATSVDECIKQAAPPPELLEETKNICNTGMAVAKGVIVAIYVISWLLQLYAYFVVERYADQLEEEEMAKLAAIMPQQPHHPMAYVGYPHRFSYDAYSNHRRSYEDTRYQNSRYQRDYPHERGEYQPQGHGGYQPGPGGQQQPPQQGRPSSEYDYSLPPQQPMGFATPRGKDASNQA